MLLDDLKLIFPNAREGWVESLADEIFRSAVDSPAEIASFCAQLHQESMGLTIFEENLYYSTPERLCLIWPNRFALPTAQGTVPEGKANPVLYVKNPQALANFVYADENRNPKFALGNTQPGDGWMYRGRGPAQITGKRNYLACGSALGVDLINHPERLKEPRIGIQSAIWYWQTHGLDSVDDDLDVRAETRLLNGGETGLKERQEFFDRAFAILNHTTEA